MRNRLLRTLAFAVVGATLVTPAASGDGGPSPGVQQGWDGIRSGAVRYVAVPAGGCRTLLLGQASAGPYLRQHSSFAFVDMKRMRVVNRLRIPGHQVFDALSPNGRYLYFVEYVSQQDFTRYRVRVYDLRAEKLRPEAVIDKREWETTMQGSPIARAETEAGWVYTLYGGVHETFIHALDTRNVTAICIDLPWKNVPKRLFEFRLRLDGEGRLVVRGPHGRVLAAIDRAGHRIVSSVRNP